MANKKIQLYTDRDKTIEASPETSANCVILSDGNDLQKVLDNDLTTPTVVHEETSFKVGVGDVNVSSSVVDGEVGRMVIKGKTYQNILPEPSLRNSMTNGKSMQKLNEGYENVNVVDGVAKSAILKGQTLVNVVKVISSRWYSFALAFGLEELTLIKPSSKYLIKILDSTSKVDGFTLSQNGSNTIFERTKGLNVVVNSNANIESKNQLFYLYPKSGVEFVESDMEQIKFMVIEYQEGMENWDIPYFTGMQSVKMPVLTTVGKNLFDGKIEKSSIDVTTGSITPNVASSWSATNYINVKNINSLYFQTSQLSNMNVVYMCFDENKNFIGHKGFYNSLTGIITPLNNTHYIRLRLPSDIDVSTTQIEQGTQPTSYEPYKSNILSTPQDLVLGGIGDVYDTLNLITGEVVENTKEIVLDGSDDEEWSILDNTSLGIQYFKCTVNNLKPSGSQTIIPSLISNIPVVAYNSMYKGTLTDDVAITSGATVSALYVWVSDIDKTVTSIRNYLQENPITVRYLLNEPVHKTVDLSSYGNWEKVILDGDDNIALSLWDSNSNGKAPDVQGVYTTNSFTDAIPQAKVIASGIKADFLGISDYNNETCFMSGTQKINFNIFKDKLSSPTVEGVKEYLKSNPITVWYQTTTSQENSITEMLSFSNGHIQLSSEEGSLIPSLDYEVSTSNSYHMDLLKNNVIYTMKCENPNGKLLVKDADITLRENRTIQIGLQYMPDDNLFINTGSWTNPMIIEGDLTSKTLPYFKGIKSSFENEDKIEVLSTGKNLLDKDNIVVGGSNFWESNRYDIKRDALNRMTLETLIDVNTQRVVVSLDSNYYVAIQQYDENECRAITSDSGWRQNEWSVLLDTKTKKINIIVKNMTDSNITNDDIKTIKNSLQIEYGSNKTTYDSYKSNVSKIPLLLPLRSLPNGVCDELIIDRMKKKAKIIQRVGEVVLDGSETWSAHNTWSAGDVACFHTTISDRKATSYAFSDRFKAGKYSELTSNSVAVDEGLRYDASSVVTYIFILKSRLLTPDISGFKKWLSQNPTTVYYELATPVVTEIDLEGFPYIYKDGHIFLNSGIAPMVEIAYNVNQAQLIIGNGETLLRHEQEILDLDKLIVSFVDCEYRLRLLKFDMELSMMSL